MHLIFINIEGSCIQITGKKKKIRKIRCQYNYILNCLNVEWQWKYSHAITRYSFQYQFCM